MFLFLIKFLNIIRRSFRFFFKIISNFVSLGISRFYIFIIVFLGFLLSSNFILQELKNKIYKTQKTKNTLIIQLTHTQVGISNKIIKIINNEKGTPISCDSIKIIKSENQKK